MSEALEGELRRTDPRSFAVRALTVLGQAGLPIALGLYAIADEGELGDMLAYVVPGLLAIVAVNFLFAWLAWRRFTYRVNPADIRVESGVIARQARSVPYDRIQDVSLEQGLVARLFGLVEVRFETGAGGKDELKLAYLGEAEGERLRELVRARRDGATGDALASDGAPEGSPRERAELLFTMGPRRLVTFGLFEFSLVVVAGFAGAVQQFDFLLPFDLWDFDAWQAQLAGPGQWLAALGFAVQVAGAVIAVLTLLTVGFVTGLVRTVLRDWDFRLERTAKGLRRRRGLVTRTDVVMPVHRVQALRIGTGIVRRLFGWRSLAVISLAQDSGKADHEVAPFAQEHEIAPIVAETGFRLPGDTLDWQRGDPRHRIDRAVVGSLVMVAVVIVGAALARWELLAVAMLGMIAIVAVETIAWRCTANAVDARQLYVRRCVLSPKLSIADRIKLQSVEIVQGPLARWRGYATLHLGLAGGRLHLAGIPLDRAQALRGAVLHSMARADFSELV